MLALVLALAAAQEATGPEFLKFDFSRERVRHRVTADAVLRNGLAVDLDAVRLSITYWDGERQVRVSNTLHLPKLAAGAAVPVQVETEQVERFDRFEVQVESGDRKFTYMGTDLDGKPPILLKAPPARLETKLAGESRPAKFPGDLALQAVVRNVGVSKGRELGLLVTLLGSDGRELHRVWVRPGGDAEAATEDVFQATLPDVPAYASAKVAAACVVADVSVPPDPFTGAGEVEVGRCRLARLSDGGVRVGGTIRNGRPNAVKELEVMFRLGGKAHALRIPELLRSGAMRPFEFHVAGVGNVEEFTYAAAYAEAQDPKEDLPPRLPQARRLSTKRLAGADAGAAPAAVPTVEVRGLRWVKGPGGRKGGPDVAFVRLALRDRTGKLHYPTGLLSATLTEGEKAHPALSRGIPEEAWSSDAEQLEGKARPESVVYDSLTGELWVGLLRPDKVGSPLKLSMTLALTGVGTWEWSGLAEPFQVAARGAVK